MRERQKHPGHKAQVAVQMTAPTLDRQIALALAAARTSKSGLISIADLPVPWQYNAHVIHGYRFTKSLSHCIHSVFHLHNETFNIWSHLLGCLYLIKILLSGGPLLHHGAEDGAELVGFAAIYYVYIAAAVLCTACSVSWHTMRCIASHDRMSCFSSLDLMGVTTMAIASVLVTQFVAFADAPFWCYSYMGATAMLGAAALTACWLPIMRRPENSWARVLVWCGLVAQGLVLPVVHLLWSKGAQRAAEVYGPLVPSYGPILFGAIIYASQFPECYWPGRFDYLGGSHNILHVAALWAILLGIDALKNVYRSREISS
ncbi:HlyIII-domain-containing protein [Thozetella sp. PMI_491]|nr:HlyIII-domain-containing protein [Thozetella sp. PMI_491]